MTTPALPHSRLLLAAAALAVALAAGCVEIVNRL